MPAADHRPSEGEAERVTTRRVKPAGPPSAPPPPPSAPADGDPPRLWHFTYNHPRLPGIVSVVVSADSKNARGLAYLVAEEFCQQVIGQIKESR